MEASRGKNGKHGRWQLTLGLKEAVCAGLGVAGLMLLCFALGALAGRGEIYRVFYQWGLLNPEAAKVAQWPPPGTGASAPLVGPVSSGTPEAPAAPPAPAPVTGVAQPASPSPVTGSLAAVPEGSSSPQKKSKGGSIAREQKAKEEELRKVRQEVVSKLKFQNSFDTTPKPRVAQKQKPKEKPLGAKAQPSQVRVAQYRDSKAAKAKIAELGKKGIKASLKQGKDARGHLYTVYKQAPSGPSESEKLAQKSPKEGEKKTKPQE